MRILVAGAGMYVTGRNNTGIGTILASLCETSRELPIERVTVAATNPDNAAVVAEATARLNTQLGTTLATDYQTVPADPEQAIAEIARNGYDCVIVSVPDHLHFAYGKAILTRGMHCLMVKPFVPTLAEGRELVRLQQAHGVYGAIEFHKRFDEANLYAKRILGTGVLGKPLYVTVDYSQRISIPLDIFRSWSEKTNIFQYLAVHYVDLVYFLTGYRPVRVSALGTSGVLRSKGVTTPDSIHASIVWHSTDGDELVTQFTCNWIDPTTTTAMSDQSYKIVGTAGRLDLDQKRRGVQLVTQRAGVQDVNPYFSEILCQEDGSARFQGYGHQSLHRFVKDVADLQAGRVTPAVLERQRPSFSEGLVSTAVIEAVNSSLARSGEWQKVTDVFA